MDNIIIRGKNDLVWVVLFSYDILEEELYNFNF